MQTRTRILLMALVVAPLAACSSTQEKPALSNATRVEAPSNLMIDATYVARVESMARQRGVEVRWVNPPTKRITSNE